MAGVVLLLFAAVPAAPVPKEKPRLRADTVRAAIGHPPYGPRGRAIARAFDRRPTVEYRDWRWWKETEPVAPLTAFTLTWASDGLNLQYGQDGKLDAAWMYNQGIEGFDRYAGELPAGLSFDDDVAAVMKKLGPDDGKPLVLTRADKPGRPGVTTTDYRFAKLGLIVGFRKTTDQPDTIQHIGLTAPGP